jgi:hypothetical protein
LTSRRILVGACALGIAFGATMLACQLLAGIEDVPKVDLVAEAAADGGPRAPRDPCAHASVPPASGLDDGDGAAASQRRYYFAMSGVYIGLEQAKTETDGAAPSGFDLDGVCSCDDRPGAKNGGAESCRGATKNCDVKGGVDDGLRAALQPYVTQFGAGLDDALNINKRIELGVQAPMIYLDGYNGLPNDPEVSVGLFLSNGILDPSGCSPNVVGIDGDDAGKRWRPQWCGQDKWTYDPAATLGDAIPRVQASGYVTNGQLVVKARQPMPIPLGTSYLETSGLILSVRIVSTATGLALEDGVIGGRAPVKGVLEAAALVYSTPANQPMFNCHPDNSLGRALLSALNKAACAGVDIMANPVDDGQGKNCDAISLAVRFRARESSTGDAGFSSVVDPVEAGCAPFADDPVMQCPPR